eukprot:TRINITY_DN31715_c0_g1_i2.p1 TRINITY_DN31715_c0_g1~~TRINITY_DN31715_c0_g1_i2.p1  ORF type:complete len:337 (+),score=80.47 TRINITY_DN31715_c0_g1_i2:99-1109(+)
MKSQHVEQDATVESFTKWLAEMKSKNNRALQEMLSETSIIRDSITSNNMDLTDFKRHSSSISQQMQTQLTDLREKLTSAFGEITLLVKQKTQSDSEMMQDVNMLQQNLQQKTAELEDLKRSYSQAHQGLQSSLIQIQNHLQVTQSEVSTARASCDRVSKETHDRFLKIDCSMKSLAEELAAGDSESRTQMMQLKEEIARIRESLSSVSAEFQDHKLSSTSAHNKLQSQVWSLEERKKQDPISPSSSCHGQGSFQPVMKASQVTASQPVLLAQHRAGSVSLPHSQLAVSPRRSPSLPQPMTSQQWHGTAPGARVPVAPMNSQTIPVAAALPMVQYMR